MMTRSFDRRLAVPRLPGARGVPHLLALVLLLTACGDDPGSDAPPPGRAPASTYAFAQEVWIPYHHASHQKGGANNPQGLYVAPAVDMTREKVRAFAETARAEARKGVAVGHLAWQYSHTPWGRLGGFTGRLPTSASPDARDRAVLACAVGELTPLYEWKAGFGFARRIDEGRARRLQRRARSANQVRARARVIHLHHRTAHPARFEFDKVSEAQAIAAAKALIAKIQAGADFATLARGTNHAERLKRTGGLMIDEGSEWVTWRSRAWGYDLTRAVLEDAPVGRVMPEPLVSPRGVDVVLVLDRDPK